MENSNKARVLAYTKATPISQKEMAEVSGGINFCHRESFRLSGAFGPDVVADVTVDW